jgi:hypothetical protein
MVVVQRGPEPTLRLLVSGSKNRHLFHPAMPVESFTGLDHLLTRSLSKTRFLDCAIKPLDQ